MVNSWGVTIFRKLSTCALIKRAAAFASEIVIIITAWALVRMPAWRRM